MKLRALSLFLAALTLTAVSPSLGQTAAPPRKITTPKQAFGFNIGDDYYLANYVQLTSYCRPSPKNPTA